LIGWVQWKFEDTVWRLTIGRRVVSNSSGSCSTQVHDYDMMY